MRKARGNKKRRKEKPDENSGPLTLLPVNHLNGDQLEYRHSCQYNNGNRGLLVLLPVDPLNSD